MTDEPVSAVFLDRREKKASAKVGKVPDAEIRDSGAKTPREIVRHRVDSIQVGKRHRVLSHGRDTIEGTPSSWT